MYAAPVRVDLRTNIAANLDRLLAGRGLVLLAVWVLVSHGMILVAVALADAAVGGDYLARWLPGMEETKADPVAAAPLLASALGLVIGVLAGWSLRRGGLRVLGLVVAALLVLLPWLHHAAPFVAPPHAYHPYLACFGGVPAWALGLMAGWGLHMALRAIRPAPKEGA